MMARFVDSLMVASWLRFRISVYNPARRDCCCRGSRKRRRCTSAQSQMNSDLLLLRRKAQLHGMWDCRRFC